MAWLQSHQALGRHPRRSSWRVVSTSLYQRLWAPPLPLVVVPRLRAGWRYSRYEADEVASAASWDGDPARLLDALIASGFVEPSLTIHDWASTVDAFSRSAGARRAREGMARSERQTYAGRTHTCGAEKSREDETDKREEEPLSSDLADPPFTSTSPKISAPDRSDWQERADALLGLSSFPLDLQRLAELLAGENKSGKVSTARVVNQLYEPLVEMEAEFPADAMRHGLRAAIAAGAQTRPTSAKPLAPIAALLSRIPPERTAAVES